MPSDYENLRVYYELADWYERWRAAAGDPAISRLHEVYAAGCATLGRRVRVELPGGRTVTGRADAIDGDGRVAKDEVCLTVAEIEVTGAEFWVHHQY